MHNRLKNDLGILGWPSGGRYGLERYAYALHRLTGLGILAYFILHIFVTGSRLGGPEGWENTMAFFERPGFKVGELLVVFAFAFHAANGVRLALVELGLLIGKPGLPAFPYHYSTLQQRPVLVIAMIVAAAIMLAGGLDFYFTMR